MRKRMTQRHRESGERASPIVAPMRSLLLQLYDPPMLNFDGTYYSLSLAKNSPVVGVYDPLRLVLRTIHMLRHPNFFLV